ncbi:MAG: TlpA family protein disulfide reductase [Aliivibrio sp.]|uniref:TlpA family protein disulfide reductase n=1 Tax=Aliivibrio sp. TaxID=1872443 RepID=UPI001A3E69DD|nr:TlpA family protein disulfide reductase [Aliivibrio sp.]
MLFHRIWVTACLLASIFILSGCKEEVAKVGASAPSIAVFDAQKNPIKLSDFKGKPVVLEFWSVTCGSCLAMMAEWEKLTKSRPDDVAVIGINIDKKEFDLEAFSQKQGFTFPLGFDQLGITQERYLISVTPTTYFVNKKGKITKMHVGFAINMNLNKYVDELLIN